MKIILTFILLIYFNLNSQTTKNDSLRFINNELDIKINSIFNKADSLGLDILFVRKYDSLNCNSFENFTTIIQKKDTCSYMYILEINEHFEINYIHTSKIGYDRTKCENDFPEIQKLLTDNYGDNHIYFSNIRPSLSNFSTSDYTLAGIINGKYIYEVFDKEFINVFHSGMLHYVLSTYLGLNYKY